MKYGCKLERPWNCSEGVIDDYAINESDFDWEKIKNNYSRTKRVLGFLQLNKEIVDVKEKLYKNALKDITDFISKRGVEVGSKGNGVDYLLVETPNDVEFTDYNEGNDNFYEALAFLGYENSLNKSEEIGDLESDVIQETMKSKDVILNDFKQKNHLENDLPTEKLLEIINQELENKAEKKLLNLKDDFQNNYHTPLYLFCFI